MSDLPHRVCIVTATRMSGNTLVHEVRGVFENRADANAYATRIHTEHPQVLTTVNVHTVVLDELRTVSAKA